jgi:hypothetical protein
LAPGRKTGGRQKGTPNKTTRAVKEFLAELVDDPLVQQAVRERIKKGDVTGFFRALENVVGKPRQSVEVSGNVEWALIMPPGDDVAED